MKKVLYSLFGVLLIFALAFSIASIARASTEISDSDECNQEFDYTKSSDFDDSRVNFYFQDNDQAITITAKTGYELVSVQLGVEDDGHYGYWTYAVISGEKFNPDPGKDINVAKVKVRMVCVSPSPSPSVSPSAFGGETNIRKPKIKVSPQVLGTTAPTPTPAVVGATLPTSGADIDYSWVAYLILFGTLAASYYLKVRKWNLAIK